MTILRTHSHLPFPCSISRTHHHSLSSSRPSSSPLEAKTMPMSATHPSGSSPSPRSPTPHCSLSTSPSRRSKTRPNGPVHPLLISTHNPCPSPMSTDDEVTYLTRPSCQYTSGASGSLPSVLTVVVLVIFRRNITPFLLIKVSHTKQPCTKHQDPLYLRSLFSERTANSQQNL